MAVSDLQRSSTFASLRTQLPRVGSMRAWLLAAGIVALGALLKPLLDTVAGSVLPPFITLFPTVAIAALIGGTRIGVAAGAASLLIAWWFWLAPFNSFVIQNRFALVTLFTFSLSSMLLALVCGYTRQALDIVVASEAEKMRAAQETVHRIKNLIAVVQAIARKVRREHGNSDEFHSTFAARLDALQVAQNLLIQQNWRDSPLADIVQASLAPFLPNPALEVQGGDAIIVPARFVSGLSLALYELATNAMKYGALSGRGGGVALSWRCAPDRTCELQWRESGAALPPLEAPRQGFGSALIKGALNREEGAEVRYEIGSAGVVAIFRWPPG